MLTGRGGVSNFKGRGKRNFVDERNVGDARPPTAVAGDMRSKGSSKTSGSDLWTQERKKLREKQRRRVIGERSREEYRGGEEG